MDKFDIIFLAVVVLVNLIVLFLAFRRKEPVREDPGMEAPGKKAPHGKGPGASGYGTGAGPGTVRTGTGAGPGTGRTGTGDGRGTTGYGGPVPVPPVDPPKDTGIKINVRRKEADKVLILACTRHVRRQCGICGTINYFNGDFCEVCGKEL